MATFLNYVSMTNLACAEWDFSVVLPMLICSVYMKCSGFSRHWRRWIWGSPGSFSIRYNLTNVKEKISLPLFVKECNLHCSIDRYNCPAFSKVCKYGSVKMWYREEFLLSVDWDIYLFKVFIYILPFPTPPGGTQSKLCICHKAASAHWQCALCWCPALLELGQQGCVINLC